MDFLIQFLKGAVGIAIVVAIIVFILLPIMSLKKD